DSKKAIHINQLISTTDYLAILVYNLLIFLSVILVICADARDLHGGHKFMHKVIHSFSLFMPPDKIS
ncbi:MAG: hypothetical protein RR686_19680, partial [Morganella sp. (in: enterobacteria)]